MEKVANGRLSVQAMPVRIIADTRTWENSLG